MMKNKNSKQKKEKGLNKRKQLKITNYFFFAMPEKARTLNH